MTDPVVRAASRADSRVQRDHEDAERRRTAATVDQCLERLEWATIDKDHKPTSRQAAEALLLALWPAPVLRSAVHNDTGAALAWMRCWEDALAELAAASRHGTPCEKIRAGRNVAVVHVAREKARAAS